MAACASKPKPVVETSEKTTVLTSENWSSVIPETDIAIVLFDAAESSWMETRYRELIDFNAPGIDYYKFTFTDEKKDKSLAKVTPAIHLYKKGFLIDKISGKPKNYEESVDFDKDLRLWMETTVNALRINSIRAISYKFNGSYVIDIGTY